MSFDLAGFRDQLRKFAVVKTFSVVADADIEADKDV